MANMTIGAELGETIGGKKSQLRKVVFSETVKGGGSATTSFNITGKLLRYITTGGSGVWTFTLNDGTADIFTSPSLTQTATSNPFYMHGLTWGEGIPMVAQTLKCTTADTDVEKVTVTIIWEEGKTF